jgi:hypothetical protein
LLVFKNESSNLLSSYVHFQIKLVSYFENLKCDHQSK